MRRTLLCLPLLLQLCGTTDAEAHEERRVDCVYPGEGFLVALGWNEGKEQK